MSKLEDYIKDDKKYRLNWFTQFVTKVELYLIILQGLKHIDNA